MSRLLYVDCFAGAAGDMFLGALLDLGVSRDAVLAEVGKLSLGAVDVVLTREARHGLTGSRAQVELAGTPIHEGETAHQEKPPGHGLGSDHGHGPGVRHDHGRPPESGHGPGVRHAHAHGHHPSHHPGSGGHGRRYTEIRDLIEKASLETETERLALRAFRLLAEAEADVHGVDVDEVHFHEVGAIDALVDVIGTCAAVALLGPARVVAAPVPLGRGVIESAHGHIPLPAPAALKILAGVPVYGLDEVGETVTPTGAALLMALATEFGPLPAMRVERIGYGVGGRDGPNRPNLLRLVWGWADETRAAETLLQLEANIDDMNPEIFEHVVEGLFAAGARDVWLTPVQMKKGRPGTVLSLLCEPARADELTSFVLRETSSIGVRYHEVLRRTLAREVREVATAWGVVRVKVARDGDEVINVSPEYEDCRRLAREHNVPLKRVFHAAWRALDPQQEQ